MTFQTIEDLQAWSRDPLNRMHPSFKNIKSEALLCAALCASLHVHQITLPDIFESGFIPQPILKRYVLELAGKRNKLAPALKRTLQGLGNVDEFIKMLWRTYEQFYSDTQADVNAYGRGNEFTMASVIYSILTTKESCPHNEDLHRRMELSLEYASTLAMKKAGLCLMLLKFLRKTLFPTSFPNPSIMARVIKSSPGRKPELIQVKLTRE